MKGKIAGIVLLSLLSLIHIWLLLETDCPYLAPAPNRGKRNSSLNLPYVVEEIAALKGVSPEEVMEKTAENAFRLFKKISP